MNELAEIVSAFETLVAEGRDAALATVVDVSGSAYRRPGARMLVAPDGRTWGGVSGGCLERDIVRRAITLLDCGGTLRCRYDAADDDDDSHLPGTSTGCGGTVEVFIQPLCKQNPGPIPWFSRLLRDREPISICTIIGATSPDRVGQCASLSELPDTITKEPVARPAIRDAKLLEPVESPHIRCEDGVEYFIETLLPAQELVIFGSGPDVVPLVAIAKVLGWRVNVIAPRPLAWLAQRFAQADRLIVATEDDVTGGVAIDDKAAVVVMTHDLKQDRAILASLRGPFQYCGLLGPRHRTRRLMASLHDGEITGVDSRDLFNPIGLAIGARSPQEIALAIAAEIQAAIRHSPAHPLRDAVTSTGNPYGSGAAIPAHKPEAPWKR